jgi:hypothetical protein
VIVAEFGRLPRSSRLGHFRSHIQHNPIGTGQRGSGAIWSAGDLVLNSGRRQGYKHTVDAMGELGRKGLPHAISAEELQTMLETSGAFCSSDASNSTVGELMARWPFLYSHPLMGTNKKAHNLDTPNTP